MNATRIVHEPPRARWRDPRRYTQAVFCANLAYLAYSVATVALILSRDEQGGILWAVTTLPITWLAPLCAALGLWVLRSFWSALLSCVINLAWLGVAMWRFCDDGTGLGALSRQFDWPLFLYLPAVSTRYWPSLLLILLPVLTLTAHLAQLLRRRALEDGAATPPPEPPWPRRMLRACKRLALFALGLAAAIALATTLMLPTDCFDTAEAREIIKHRLPPEEADTLRADKGDGGLRSCAHDFSFTRRGKTLSISFLPDAIHGPKFFDVDEETRAHLSRRPREE